MTYALTTQQAEIVNAVVSGKRNVAVVARAGTGKSSTIEAIINEYVKSFPSHELLVCAFNKAITVEMGERLAAAGHKDFRKVAVQTAHSMGYGLVRFVFKSKIDGDKVSNIIRAQNDAVYSTYRGQIEQLVRYAKDNAFGFFHGVGDTHKWYQLAEHHDIDGLEDEQDMDAVVAAAQHIYRLSLDQTDVVDFSDMILFPLVKNMRVKFTKDLIFVDEAQDLSPARQALILKFMKPGGRIVVVGDDRQAIYGFAGADAEALPGLIRKLDAEVLPLTVTWRCPKAVVAFANRLVPDLEAAAPNAEGEVLHGQAATDAWAALEVKDAILCRKMAPLVAEAYKLIRKGTPAKVEGRDIGKGIKALVGRWKVASIDALLQRLDVYRIRETQKAMAKHNESKVTEIEDRVNTVVEIAGECIRQGKKDVQAIYDAIDALFGDDVKHAVVLCTFHRSKGREWNNVFILPSSPFRAKQAWQLQQEENLRYVAYTRAKKTLVLLPE